VTGARVALDTVAARWQWALDAADHALAADRVVLTPGTLRTETGRLVDERQRTAALLARLGALYPDTPRPWLASTPVAPRQLGLPAATEACLFDLDGVLTDSDALHAAAWAAALDPVLLDVAHEAERQFAPFDRGADYRAYFDGRPRLEGIRLFLAGRGLHVPEAALDDIARRKGELVEHGIHTRGVASIGGARRYLQAAGLAHLRRAAVSASTTAAPMLERAGLTHLIDTTVDAQTIRRDGLRSRPSPDVLLRACEQLAVAPSQAVSLTHSGAGIVAAAAIGMPAIAVATGEEADALRAYGAASVVPALELLLEPRLRAR
jgi:beta-phosphoglucomutase-like phosphatase (HAD superfamily)